MQLVRWLILLPGVYSCLTGPIFHQNGSFVRRQQSTNDTVCSYTFNWGDESGSKQHCDPHNIKLVAEVAAEKSLRRREHSCYFNRAIGNSLYCLCWGNECNTELVAIEKTIYNHMQRSRGEERIVYECVSTFLLSSQKKVMSFVGQEIVLCIFVILLVMLPYILEPLLEYRRKKQRTQQILVVRQFEERWKVWHRNQYEKKLRKDEKKDENMPKTDPK